MTVVGPLWLSLSLWAPCGDNPLGSATRDVVEGSMADILNASAHRIDLRDIRIGSSPVLPAAFASVD